MGGIGCHGTSSYGNFLDLGLIGYCIDILPAGVFSRLRNERQEVTEYVLLMNDWLTGIVFGDVPTLLRWHQFVPGSWHLNEQPSSLLNYTNSCNQDATAKKIKKSINQEVFLQHQTNDQKGMPKFEQRKRECSLPTGQKYEVEMPMTNDATTTERNWRYVLNDTPRSTPSR